LGPLGRTSFNQLVVEGQHVSDRAEHVGPVRADVAANGHQGAHVVREPEQVTPEGRLGKKVEPLLDGMIEVLGYGFNMGFPAQVLCIVVHELKRHGLGRDPHKPPVRALSVKGQLRGHLRVHAPEPVDRLLHGALVDPASHQHMGESYPGIVGVFEVIKKLGHRSNRLGLSCPFHIRHGNHPPLKLLSRAPV